MRPPEDRPLSALPSPRARTLAFLAIVVAGVCGALIGWSFVELQCTGSCATPAGLAAIVGAGVGAGGVAIVAVLVLRAMGEWRRITEEQLAGGDGTAEPGEDRPGEDQPPSRSTRNPSA